MKKQLIVCGVALLAAAGAVAQEQPTDEQLHTPTRPAATLSQTDEGSAAAAQNTEDDAALSVRDAAITARIETTYMLNKYLSPFSINTTTRNGQVTLEGNVDDEIERELAERLARSIDGVTQVSNKLVVSPEAAGQNDAVLSQNPEAAQRELSQAAGTPGNESPAASPAPPAEEQQQVQAERPWRQRVSDETLRADVRSRLAYNTLLKGADFDVEVDDGEVELEGTVPSEEAKRQAEQLVRDINGVVSVENDLRVDAQAAKKETIGLDATTVEATPVGPEQAGAENAQPTLAQRAEQAQDRLSKTADSVMASMGDEWVEKRVEANLALNRNVSVLDLDVEVEDGVATVDGHVLTEQQKQVVQQVAETTTGVRQVVNNVAVSSAQPQ